jgi:hypothetical protein
LSNNPSLEYGTYLSLLYYTAEELRLIAPLIKETYSKLLVYEVLAKVSPEEIQRHLYQT